MARPKKASMDYFPIDVHMNNKMRLLEARFGVDGFGVIVKLWMEIYGSNGYYCIWNDDVELLFATENKIDKQRVSDIIEEALKRDIFSEKLYREFGILTSKGVQERYLQMTTRRNRVNFEKKFLLAEIPSDADNVCKKGVNVDENSINDDSNPQSKVKESKVNKSKENENTVNENTVNENKENNIKINNNREEEIKENNITEDKSIEKNGTPISTNEGTYKDTYPKPQSEK